MSGNLWNFIFLKVSKIIGQHRYGKFKILDLWSVSQPHDHTISFSPKLKQISPDRKYSSPCENFSRMIWQKLFIWENSDLTQNFVRNKMKLRNRTASGILLNFNVLRKLIPWNYKYSCGYRILPCNRSVSSRIGSHSENLRRA
jgi:hypothetical protein